MRVLQPADACCSNFALGTKTMPLNTGTHLKRCMFMKPCSGAMSAPYKGSYCRTAIPAEETESCAHHRARPILLPCRERVLVRPVPDRSLLHTNRVMVFMAAALAEELIFRGALQPRFISRYGVIRGLAPLSIVFAGWHISADFPDGFKLTSAVIVTRVALRLMGAIGLCFVTGWLAIKTGSVLPSSLAHGLYNVLGKSSWGQIFSGSAATIYIAWIGLGYFLLRRYSVDVHLQKRTIEGSVG
jgi:hypothetical protein